MTETILGAYRERLTASVPYESGNYPYVTARVKARKAALYSPDTYAKLLQMEIPQIARFLGEGAYKEELLALGATVRGVDLIERATSERLAKAFTEVIDMCEGGLREMVANYLDRWDVYNIKTILRAKLYGAPVSEVRDDLIPAGRLEASFLETLIAAEGIGDVFARLQGTIYAEARERLGEEFDPTTGFAAYEDALSHVYYRTLVQSIRPVTDPARFFLEFVRKEVDMLNLKTMLRAWKAKAVFARPVFLEGGLDLTPEDLREMATLDLQGLLGRLSRYPWYEDIAPVLRAVEERGVAVVEREFEKVHLKEASRYSHLHPLSVLPVLDYLASMTREVENIRIVARGKEHGVAIEDIKALLVI